MLYVTIPMTQLWDEESETFINTKEKELQLEHSLVSISKWESRYKKPFISKDPKTREETIYYIRCMTVSQNVSNEIYDSITDDIICKVNEYIDDPMTATTIKKDNKKGRSRIMTSELIYGFMVLLQIPFECQKWHLNRLITLIAVCSIKNEPPKKNEQERCAQK